jgi:hypothetical protein
LNTFVKLRALDIIGTLILANNASSTPLENKTKDKRPNKVRSLSDPVNNEGVNINNAVKTNTV